jgi:hypothetical protein
MKNSIEYAFDNIENGYFIWFNSSTLGSLTGDIEICKFVDISEEKFNSILKNYHTRVSKIYPNSDYALTYFDYEYEVKEVIKILQSYLISKLLING